MPPLKSQGKGNVSKQKAEPKRKSAEKCEKRSSKPSSQIPDEQQKKMGHSSMAKNKRNDEGKSSKMKSKSRVDESKKKDLELQEKQKPTVKGKNRSSQPQSKEQSQNMMKKRSKCSAKTPDRKQRMKTKSRGAESEEDQLESDPESSVEATEGETSNQEEEQGSDGEPDETQMSEDSIEEAAASDTQSDTEQTEPEESETKKAKSNKGEPEFQSGGTEESEEEEENLKEEAEESEMVSDKDEEHETTEEDTNEVSAPRTRGKQTKLKNVKADKQAKKAEKQREKLEKQKLKKEAKEKAKEEKKQKKKQFKGLKPAAEDVQPPTDLHSDNDERNSHDSNEEETQNRAINDQNVVLSLQGKGKHIEAVKEQFPLRGKPNSLFSKLKMASSGEQADNSLTNIDKEPSELEDSEAVSSKSKEQLISRRKSITAIRRVSGWIQKKIPRDLNLRKKLSALTKAIGVSRWLSLRATKQKQGAKMSKGNIFKHKTAMKITSKTTLAGKKNKKSSEDKLGQEQNNLHQEEEEEGAAGRDKEAEAKYAIVLPRMNKLGKLKEIKTTPGLLPAPKSSGEPSTSEPKPPKPGAKLVLPVKPDLLILKSVKKPFGERPSSGRNALGRISDSHGSTEGSANLEESQGRAPVEHPDAISVLQAARGKLKPSQVNLSKMTGKTISSGPTPLKEPDMVREKPAVIPRSSSQTLHGEAVPGGRSLYEEEADREVAQLMGDCGLHPITQAEVHWSGKCWMSGDPQV